MAFELGLRIGCFGGIQRTSRRQGQSRYGKSMKKGMEYAFIFKLSFIEIQFTYHKVYLSIMYNFNGFTCIEERGNHHNITLEHCHYPQRKHSFAVIPMLSTCSPSHLTQGNYYSIFYLSIQDTSYKIESQHMRSFHLGQCFQISFMLWYVSKLLYFFIAG